MNRFGTECVTLPEAEPSGAINRVVFPIDYLVIIEQRGTEWWQAWYSLSIDTLSLHIPMVKQA